MPVLVDACVLSLRHEEGFLREECLLIQPDGSDEPQALNKCEPPCGCERVVAGSEEKMKYELIRKSNLNYAS